MRLPESPGEMVDTFGPPGLLFLVVGLLCVIGLVSQDFLWERAAAAIQRAIYVAAIAMILGTLGVFHIIKWWQAR